MSLNFQVYLVCPTERCRGHEQPLITSATLTAILLTKCGTCQRTLYPAAVRYREAMIALNNDVSVCLIGNDQIKILGKLQHIFEEARSVAYHASELLAFRTCLCAFLSTPTPDVANRKQASKDYDGRHHEPNTPSMPSLSSRSLQHHSRLPRCCFQGGNNVWNSTHDHRVTGGKTGDGGIGVAGTQLFSVSTRSVVCITAEFLQSSGSSLASPRE
jgi:hypothetical protein